MKCFCQLLLLLFLFVQSSFSQQLDLPWYLMIQDPNVTYEEFHNAFSKATEGRDPTNIKDYKKYIFKSQYIDLNTDQNGAINELDRLIRLRKLQSESNDQKFALNWQSIEPADQTMFKCCAWAGCGPVLVDQDADVNLKGRLLEMNFAKANPDIWWLSSPSGGFWKSTDQGETWENMSESWPHGGCDKIVSHPTDENTVYVATGGDVVFSSYGVQRSRDGGNSWSLLNDKLGGVTAINQFLMHPFDSETLFLATNNGLKLSTNEGDTWDDVSPLFGNWLDAEIIVSGNNITMMALVRDNQNRMQLYRSTDFMNWESVDLPYHLSSTLDDDLVDARIAYSPANPQRIYIVGWPQKNGLNPWYEWNMTHDLYVSNNGGTSFEKRNFNIGAFTTVGVTWGTYQLEVNPDNADEVMFGSICSARSTDGGNTWENITWHQVDKQYFTWHPVTKELYSIDDGGIEKMSASGEIIDVKDPPLIQYYDITHAPDNSLFVGGTQDAGTMMAVNGKRYRIGGGDGMTSIVDPVNSNTIYISSQRGFFQKATVGNNFNISTILFPNKVGEEDGTWVSQMVMHPWNHNKLYAAIRNVHMTADGGNTWVNISNDQIPFLIDHLRISESNPDVLIVASNGGEMMRTNNEGLSWENLNAPFRTIRSFIIDPNNDQRMWVVGQDNDFMIGIFESTDGGFSWNNIAANINGIGFKDIIYQKGNNGGLYVSTLGVSAVFFKELNEANWMDVSDGLPNTSEGILDIVYSDAKIRVATYGRGLYEAPLPSLDPAYAQLPPDQPFITLTDCGQDIILMANSFDEVSEYLWYLDDSFVTSTVTPELIPTQSGEWSVRAKNGQLYSYASEQRSVDVSAELILIGPTHVCQGEVVGFTVPNIEQDATYEWILPDGSIDCNRSSYLNTEISQSGVVQLHVTSDCGVKTYTQQISLMDCQSVVLDYDGQDDYMLVNGLDASAISDYTIECMVSFDQFSNDWKAIMDFGADWNVHQSIRIHNGTLSYIMSNWDGGWIGNEVPFNVSLNTDTWYHIAVSYNSLAKRVDLYLDGDLVNTAEDILIEPNQINFTQARIGKAFHWENDLHFDGKMASFRYWKIHRSAQEIADHQHCINEEDISNLLIDYNFGNGSVSGDNSQVLSIANNAPASVHFGELINFAMNASSSNFVNGNIDQNGVCFDLVSAIVDADNDGYDCQLDCDDSDPAINPGAEDIPNNGIDEDCDGSDLLSSVSELSGMDVSIFPNPTRHQVNILVKNNVDYQVQLVDLNGKVYLQADNLKTLDMSPLSEGVYLVYIIDNKSKRVYTDKLIKM